MSGPFIICDRCSKQLSVKATYMTLTFKEGDVEHLCETCTEALRKWAQPIPVDVR